MGNLYDVVKVNIESLTVSIIAEKKKDLDADAIENMCISRQGVDEYFFATVESGKYKDGEQWTSA